MNRASQARRTVRKIFVVSHSCVTAVNQQLYAEVEARTGWDITLVCPSNWIDEYGRRRTVARWPDFKGKIELAPVWKPGNIILHAYRTRFGALLRRHQPDAIYVNHEPYAVATAQVYRANRATLRRPIGFYSCQNIRKKYPFPFSWSEAKVYRDSSFAFPITDAVDAVMRAKGYAAPSTVLPLGCDPAVYFPRPEREELRRKLRQPPAAATDVGSDGQNGTAADVLIGYVGRVVESKGLATLLRALAGLTDLSWRMVVVGSGPFEGDFDRMAAGLGLASRVTRIGFVPHEQVPVYYGAFDAVVVPSETQPNWKEQFGRVITEALACGTPVVGSDSGEIPNLIRSTGGGLVFPERQPGALAEQLRKIITGTTLRRELAEKGRTAVLEQYSNGALAAKFAETIERAIRDDGTH